MDYPLPLLTPAVIPVPLSLLLLLLLLLLLTRRLKSRRGQQRLLPALILG